MRVGCEGEGSWAGFDAFAVGEVVSYVGEGGGDDEGSSFLFFDVEVMVVACDEDVGVCYSGVSSSHGLVFPPVPYSVEGSSVGSGDVAVGASKNNPV